MNLEHAVCPSCGAQLQGKFCSQCGERLQNRERLRFSRLLGTAFEELTDFEHSKLLRTLGTLLFKPGVLTLSYWAGARSQYIGPIKLFITAFALSLFVYTVIPSTAVFDLNTSIRTDRTGTYDKLTSEFAAKARVTKNVFIEQVNERWRRYISWSQAIYPLVLAVALQLLFWNRGRYLAEHAVFALHYVTFSLCLGLVLWPAYALTGVNLTALFYAVAIFNAFIWLIYMFTAIRTAYGGRAIISIARAGVLVIVYYFAFAAFVFGALIMAMLRTVRALTPVR